MPAAFPPSILKPLQLTDLSGGMISFASGMLLPANTASQAINLHFDTIGEVTQRFGTTKLGDTVNAGQTPTGTAQYVSSDGATNRLFAGFGTSVFGYDGSTYTAVRTGLTGANVRMTEFANVMIMVGGGSDTALSTGGAFTSGTGIVTSAPSGKFVESFKERVYIAGNATNPDRLFRSSIISSTGTVTWDTSSTGPWVDVNPDDGQNMTALSKTADVLTVYKDFSLYRYNGTALAYVGPVGTPSQESVVALKGINFFFSSNPLGIYATDGTMPVEIGRPVQDWLQAMDPAFYDNVSALADDNHVYVNIGSVTRSGRTYTNAQLVYTVSSKNWHVNLFADDFRAMCPYITAAGAVTFVGADTDGMVQTLFSGNTDNGTPITYEYVTKELEGDARSTTKSLTEAALFVKNGNGTYLSVAEGNGVFKPAGVATAQISTLKGLDFRGNYFRLKATGINAATPVVIQGMGINHWVSLGILDRS